MRDGEQAAFARSATVPFLEAGNEDAVAHWTPHLELARAWLAEDRGRVVGNCCVFSRDVTVPGPVGEDCPAVPFAAVSGVGVHPTHRRQGLLRRMMTTMLDHARERGEAFAGLLASESHIYGRFGFGLATSAAAVAIDVRQKAFRHDLHPAPVPIELLDPEKAAKVLPDLHDRLRRRRAGDVSRNDATWSGLIRDLPSYRGGMSARMYAVTDGGFVAYRGKERDSRTGTPGRVEVRDLYAENPEIEAALWRFVLDLDLVDEITAFPRPLDDPIRYRLAEPRGVRTTRIEDFLWIRVLDTPAALTARAYHQPGRLVLDVARLDVAALDDRPDPAAGRWVLDAGPDGVSCSPAGPGDATDVRIGLAELGALYPGGVNATTLAAAGRLDEERAGAAAVADRLFATVPGPFSGTGF